MATATIELPTEKTKPTLSFDTAKVMLYGPPKVGKTTLASTIDPDHTLILATEAGTGGLEAYVLAISSWEEFRQSASMLAKGDHGFKMVVIDTVDELYKFAQEEVQKELNIKHPSDLEYGKGWAAVSDKFRLGVGHLAARYGLWLISHSKDTEVKQRVGSITKTVPTLTGKAGEWVEGFCDLILLADFDNEGKHVLRTRPTENYNAGSRGAILPDPIQLTAPALKGAIDTAYKALHKETQSSKTAVEEQSGPVDFSDDDPNDMPRISPTKEN